MLHSARRLAYAIALLLPLAAPAAAAEPAASAPPATAARLADFAWLAGRWVERDEGMVSEEHWLPPEGDVMLGTWRLLIDGRAKVLELLALRQDGERVLFYLRHFDPALVAREEREHPIVLAASAPEPGLALFVGRGSDGAPLRISYRQRRGATGLVEGYDGVLEHGEKRQEFHFTAAPGAGGG